ncbi:MAG TPA: ORF6N domain-containing protein [Acidobacteriota bacterium]|nr:ORF6N domain-containing protein [Acidobacteriota bacterium]HNT18664.1 ORF6N domain-containing protein [Acidobacteriota bacterium]
MADKSLALTKSDIQSRISTVRNAHVMLDSDLAALFGVETKVLNQAVKRNLERFPLEFSFQLTKTEYESLRSQFVTLEKDAVWSQNVTLESKKGKHTKYLPRVFTEQGVAMLSAVLKSETAVQMSIQIIKAFVAMRKFILSNAQVFQRLDTLELKQLETEIKMDKVLAAIESKDAVPKQGIFFDGQVFDAYKFASDLIRSAKNSIVLIDNYVDESVLTLLSKAGRKAEITVYTKTISKQLALDTEKYGQQYRKIKLKEFGLSHDRFLIIDDKTVYYIGASLKDLGKKWFAFSRFDKDAFKILERLKGDR